MPAGHSFQATSICQQPASSFLLILFSHLGTPYAPGGAILGTLTAGSFDRLQVGYYRHAIA
jgi:predicted membrane protein